MWYLILYIIFDVTICGLRVNYLKSNNYFPNKKYSAYNYVVEIIVMYNLYNILRNIVIIKITVDENKLKGSLYRAKKYVIELTLLFLVNYIGRYNIYLH